MRLVIWIIAPTALTLIGAGAVFCGFLVADLIVYGRWP